MKQPLSVGITGGIGAGKSIVSRIFQSLGVPVYDADSRAKDLMVKDPDLVGAIKKEFGLASYHSDGSLDRSFLAKVAFGNRRQLNILNELVHPRVAQDYFTWTEQHHLHPYLLREAALLYETGIYASIDKMIVVSAPRPLRIARVLKRDTHRTEKDVEAIVQNQWPEEEKLNRADYIIYNDDQQLVIPQVLELHHTLIALSENSSKPIVS